MALNYINAIDLARALQAYGVRKTTQTTGVVNKLLEKVRFRKASFDNLFPTIFSLHGLDIEQAISRAIADKDISEKAGDYAIEGINRAMEVLASRYEILSSQKLAIIQKKFNEFVEVFNENGGDSLDSKKQERLEKILENIRTVEFSKPLIVQYVKGSKTRAPSLKLAFTSFSNLRTIVNNVVESSVAEVLKEKNVKTSKLNDETYLTTKIINWGHTQAITDSGTRFLSGKLLAEFLSLSPLTKGLQGNDLNSLYTTVVDDFIENTGQEKTVIRLTKGNIAKGDSGILKLAIESGIFQLVKVQNRRENQQDLAQLETKWSILDSVSRNNKLLSIFKVSSLTQLADKMLRVRSSPSFLEDFEMLLANSIKGTKTNSTAKSVVLANITNPIKKRRVKVAVKQNTTTKLRSPKGIILKDSVNLTSLQRLLDAALVQQVKQNMGRGDRRDVLNLRTGRFAESVRVERLSQSREGMITAFYSYMRNPYATFSAGGRQESPKTRDPKLLISKSIREIAAQAVTNRLRAVNV